MQHECRRRAKLIDPDTVCCRKGGETGSADCHAIDGSASEGRVYGDGSELDGIDDLQVEQERGAPAPSVSADLVGQVSLLWRAKRMRGLTELKELPRYQNPSPSQSRRTRRRYRVREPDLSSGGRANLPC